MSNPFFDLDDYKDMRRDEDVFKHMADFWANNGQLAERFGPAELYNACKPEHFEAIGRKVCEIYCADREEALS